MATIITKNSSTASSVPAAGSLVQGELAVNVTDKKLYTKDSGGNVVKVVGSLGNQEANAVAITGGTITGMSSPSAASDVATKDYVDTADNALQAGINAKASLASPAFTGTPTAPTASPGTSTTQLATTAFVMTAAFTASLPAQTGNAGKFVTTDGSTASWAEAVTPAATQTLTNKTLSTGTQFSADVTGGDFNITRTMFKDTGWVYFNSDTTSSLNYTNGSHQRWAPAASSNPTLSISNWPPSSNLGELLIEAVNLGAAGTITFPTANWIKTDGTFAASPSAAGVTFQSSGTDFILLWTRDAGTTLYAKVIR